MSNVFTKITRPCLILIFICAQFNTLAQNVEFSAAFDELSELIIEVKSKKYTYDQQILFVENGVIKYGYTQTSLKGTAKSFEYELNLADIDPYVVREYTSKDLIMVNLKARNGQKLIKVYEDNEVKTYTDELAIISLNIDNAREIRNVIEKAIPLAEQIVKNKLSLETYPEMVEWLTSNVGDANTNDKLYRQIVKKDEDYPGKIYFLLTINSNNSSVQHDYEFNLADINVNSINFKVTGNQFGLEFETVRKNNLIKYTKDGEAKPFTNDVIIYTNNVEEARDLRNVLNMAIPKAEKEVEASFPDASNLDNAMEVSQQFVKNLTYGTTTIEQTLRGDCLAELKVMEITEKANTETLYSFNVMDINANVLDYDVSSNKMFVEPIMNDKQKLFQVRENGELKSYVDDIKIFTTDVEVARRLKFGLKQMVEHCVANYETKVPSSGMEDRINWLSENVVEVRGESKTFNQSIEQIETEEGETTFKYSRREISEKSSTEYIYEFNVSDLNVKSIGFVIKGTDVQIGFITNFKEKIVKAYKDGEIQNYEDDFEIYAQNIEDARNLIEAFKQIIDDDKNK